MGERRSRARDGPSAPVRRADERSEGTAQRREDPPGQGIRRSAQSPNSQQSFPPISAATTRKSIHRSTQSSRLAMASASQHNHRARSLMAIFTQATALSAPASTNTAKPKRKQISPAFSFRQCPYENRPCLSIRRHRSGKPTGGCPGRSIRSAERREEARIRPQDVGERRSRARGGPSAPVRQADERSEGTAQRREDPPGQGIRRSAQSPNSQQSIPPVSAATTRKSIHRSTQSSRLAMASASRYSHRARSLMAICTRPRLSQRLPPQIQPGPKESRSPLPFH